MPQAIEATDAAERSAIYVLRSEGNPKVGSQKTCMGLFLSSGCFGLC